MHVNLVWDKSGDIHFDNEYFTNLKTKPGDGKYNIFSVALHELGHNFGIFHSNEKDSVMTPFYKHGFSIENKYEIPGESDKALIQQMYGKTKRMEARAVFNSKKEKVMERRPPEPGKVKIVFTLKSKHFAGGSEDF